MFVQWEEDIRIPGRRKRIHHRGHGEHRKRSEENMKKKKKRNPRAQPGMAVPQGRPAGSRRYAAFLWVLGVG
jgi:hypothetical protein